MIAVISCTSMSNRTNDFSAPLGSKENPIRCDSPIGEREYFSRLTGPNGEKILYYRVGSFDPAPDGHTLDGYEFGFEEGEYKYFVFMDMYHENYFENEPIEGFKIEKVEQDDLGNADKPHS